MKITSQIEEMIAEVPCSLWTSEVEQTSSRYHLVAAWAAIIFDPVFAITDYLNFPENWKISLCIRIVVSCTILFTVWMQKKLRFLSHITVLVAFLGISLQNAFTYTLISDEDLLGHNLNYMALFIGAAMFVMWRCGYSAAVLLISAIATTICIGLNPAISANQFFIKGGLLLTVVSVFMFALIKTRYDLTVKEIKTRLALKASNAEILKQNEEIQLQNEEIQMQAEKIKKINDNLELLIQERTYDLERKNKVLEEYAFINAHKLRSPVASILGLVHLAGKLPLGDDGEAIMMHLQRSTEELDTVVRTITRTIERS